jgi:cystathionine beta-lyase family protein involved in aluminum resistance
VCVLLFFYLNIYILRNLSLKDYSISYKFLQILKINIIDIAASRDNIQDYVVIIFLICYVYFLF